MDLKKNIRAHGFTMAQVGERMQPPRSQQSVSQAVTGNPSLQFLQQLADAMGITLAELVSDDDAPARLGQHGFVCPHCGRPVTVAKAEE